MIFNCIEYITRELKQQKGKLKKYKKELAVLPKGGLMISKENKGTKYYSKYDMFRGKRRTKYLGSAENQEVQQLQKRYFLEKSIEAMENNIPLMENFLKNYKRIDPNYMQEHFPKAYQALPQSCFDAAGALDIEKWGSADFVRSTKYKENLTQTTAKGEHVRTKSEMNIANMLKSRGLQYRYEQVINLDGHKIAPDFRILDPRENRIIYLEHLGLISDFGYWRKSMYRIWDYMKKGIIPGVNLILTYEDLDGNLDSLMLERTLDLWFGPAA